MAVVPFAEWKPDDPSLGDSLIECYNVVPATKKSYGPFYALSSYSTALTARCQGAVGCIDNTSTVYVFAGDATKLYSITVASTTPADISKVGGYTMNSDDRWNFAQYGNRVMACSIQNPIQSFVMGSSSVFADLAAAAPYCRYIAATQNFVVACNTWDASNGYQPQAVWWCGFNDPLSWPSVGSTAAAAAQSDYQILSGDGGWNQGIVAGLGWADFLVFQERKIWRAAYVGSPAIFDFKAIEGATGTPAPGSIVQWKSAVFYLGQDGFKVIENGATKDIGATRVDKSFFADFDLTYADRMTGVVDPASKLVIWSYCGAGSSGTPNKYIAYNWAVDRWSQGDLAAETLLRTITFGYSLDGLDAISTDIDALSFSLDSRVWTGGKSNLSAFDGSHRLAYFTGSTLEATITTQEITGDNGRRLFCRGIRPVVDGGTSTVAIRYRDLPTASLSTTAESTIGVNGVAPFRVSARYMRARVKIAAAGTWSHAIGIEPEVIEEGTR